jgi:large subunit ribosomal protein L23
MMMQRPLSTGAAVVGSAAACSARRHRFYRPLAGAGVARWKERYGDFSRKPATHMYQHRPMDPKPIREAQTNNYFGKLRLWNAIPSKVGIAAKKAEQWGYPHRKPPPKGLRQSTEFFPHWFPKYFPEVEARLTIDSVLNTETSSPQFVFPSHMSRAEIANYLRNIYNMENIVHVETRNYSGRRYKNEVGDIRQLPDVKKALVHLEAPVMVELKQIKASSDAGDEGVKA